MDIEKLIAAAVEIDRLALLQEQKTLALSNLARDAKRGMNKDEIHRRRLEIDQGGATVIDFSSVIHDLRAALSAKPSRKVVAVTVADLPGRFVDHLREIAGSKDWMYEDGTGMARHAKAFLSKLGIKQ